jgi:hypothetical protein
MPSSGESGTNSVIGSTQGPLLRGVTCEPELSVSAHHHSRHRVGIGDICLDRYDVSARRRNLPPRLLPLFVLDMGEPVKIVDLAQQMIRLAGLRGLRRRRFPWAGRIDRWPWGASEDHRAVEGDFVIKSASLKD